MSRGFNDAFSTSMLMLQDYRFAGVPSLRVNVPALFTGSNEDIDPIEILQGPAAALYGPNSGAGVLHIITKSPFQSAGTTLTVDGGERSLLRGGLRHASVVNEQWPYKISGEAFTAHDFEYVDPNEPTTYSATDTRIPASRRGKANVHDFDVSKYTGEARLDFRPMAETELISTAGYSLAPAAGKARIGGSITPAWFRQDLSDLPLRSSMFDAIQAQRPLWNRGQVQNHLGAFGFSGEEVFREISTLSGGERARMALALMTLSRANLLVLDEPTNHLDVENIEVLEDALDEYEGTVLLVSHDRAFLREVATRVWAFDGTQLTDFDGPFVEWEEDRARRAAIMR